MKADNEDGWLSGRGPSWNGGGGGDFSRKELGLQEYARVPMVREIEAPIDPDAGGGDWVWRIGGRGGVSGIDKV